MPPALSFPPELLLQAQGIRAAIFDVDGVLTDGRIYIGEHGETVKAFSTLDGHGLKLLARAGIVPVVVTGRDSPAVRRRLADLGIVHAAFGAQDKLAAAEHLLAGIVAGGVAWGEVAAMGDDWPDLPLLRRASRGACTSAPRDGCRGRPRGGARVLRPAAGRVGALCRAARRGPRHAGPGPVT